MWAMIRIGFFVGRPAAGQRAMSAAVLLSLAEA
jgi:hypothetical protein